MIDSFLALIWVESRFGCSFSMLRRIDARHGGEMVLAARRLQDQCLQVLHEDGERPASPVRGLGLCHPRWQR